MAFLLIPFLYICAPFVSYYLSQKARFAQPGFLFLYMSKYFYIFTPMTISPRHKIKDLIILLAMVAMLIILSQMAKAQDLKPSVTSYVALQGPQIVPCVKADNATEVILSAFTNDGEYGLDKALNGSDSSWYYGADVYLASDEEALLSTIQADQKASYKEKGVKKATVSVASDGEYMLVMIYSFR